MIIIESIEIKNFRSITSLETIIQPKDLNIIVGQNDIGKSNFLKALNLFFNGETEIGNPFRFKDDFSRLAITPNKKAEEIVIKLTFQVPKRFKDNENIVWTKKWREDGMIKDEILTIKGNEPSGRGGAIQWIRKINYKYVPAVRGTEYFNYLMGNLHDALSQINPAAFNDSSKKFINGLKKEVSELVKSIFDELGYSSEISIPADFKSLFSTLDFTLNKGGTSISLNKRGDGIKAQYIPIILKFIANHQKSIRGRSVIRPETIWGFEEPENNMELMNAFKLARVFASFSDDLQVFINTHSPAFYSLAKEYSDITSLYLAKQENGEGATKIINMPNHDMSTLDEEMGVLPIISEYLKTEIEKRREAEARINELEKLHKKVEILVFTEDEDDVYIRRILELHGFNMTTLQIVSYNGRDNLYSAMHACEMEIFNRLSVKDVIFHRDRDTYDDDELDKDRIEVKIKQLERTKGCRFHLFITDNYDLESYFINSKYIKSLYPSLEIDRIDELIRMATEETKTQSIDKLIGKVLSYNDKSKWDPKQIKYSKLILEVHQKYDNNTIRYRYGKVVLGALKFMLQKELKRNINLTSLPVSVNELDCPSLHRIIQVIKKKTNRPKIKESKVVAKKNM